MWFDVDDKDGNDDDDVDEARSNKSRMIIVSFDLSK